MGCAEGGRNEGAAKLIGHWLRMGVSSEETWQFAKMWNMKNQPPMDEGELGTVFNSITSSNDAKTEKIDISKYLITVESLIKGFNKDQSNRIQFGGDNLYLLGGVPSSGKTALCNNIADNLCLNGFPVIIFSFDDGDRELQSRTIARFTKIDIEDLNLGRLAEDHLEKIRDNQNLEEIFNLKHVVCEAVAVEKWQGLVDAIILECKIKPIIFIRYSYESSCQAGFWRGFCHMIKEQIAKYRYIEKAFIKIRDFWCWGIPYPKHRHVDTEVMQNNLKCLKDYEKYLYDYSLFEYVCSEIRRAIAKVKKNNKVSSEVWKNISEHGFNKVARPLIARYDSNHGELSWEDKYGQQSIIKCTSDFASCHFTVVDVVGYFYLLQINNHKLPEALDQIFNNVQTLQQFLAGLDMMSDKSKLKVTFDDDFFRKFSGFSYPSAKICKLITEVADIQFKFTYPVMLIGESGSKKECPAVISDYSKIFHLEVECKKRSDGNIAKRIYTITFDTVLGVLFVHNKSR